VPQAELALQLLPLLVALVVLLGLNLGGAWLMNGARAYVAGESRWSKAQKDAVYNLRRYASTRDPLALENFQMELRLPQGDRRAREALLRDPPDLEVAHHGFREGGVPEEDIPAIVWIFRYLRWQPEIGLAVRAWTEGDLRIEQLERLSVDMQAAVRAGDDHALDRGLAQLRRLDGELTLLELQFSEAIGHGSRELARALRLANLAVGGVLLLFGAWQASRMIQRRRRAEYLARRSGERLELATTGANDGIWDWHLAQREVQWTARVPELLGFSDGDDEFRRYVVRDHIHPDDTDRATRALRRHFAGLENRLDVSLRLRRRDGSYRWYRARGMAIRDALRQPVRVLGTLADIHDSVMADQALRAAWTHSQQVAGELELALDGANVALWAYDTRSGRILHHRRWQAILGRTEMPATFDEWLALTHPDDRAQRVQLLQRHLSNQTRYYESEFRMRHADGHWVWVRSRGRATERDADGHALQYAGAVMNITEQVAAREVERREQEFLRAMIEGIDVGVMVSDQDRVLYANSAYCHLLGYQRPEELAGMALARLMPSAEREADIANRLKAAAGTVVPLRVARLKLRGGGQVKVVTNLSAVDWKGAPHYIATASALADHTVLEQQLNALSDRFERAMLSELESQQAAIARELHDSLGSVLAGVSLLLGNARASTRDEQVAAVIERSQGELKLAAELTRAMSRGIMPVGTHPGALAQALEQFASDLGPLKGVDCEVEAEGDFSTLPSGTGNHIYRIVQEATTNAIKHGGATEIRIVLAESRGQFTVTISDNGRGFDPHAVPVSHSGIGLKSMQARAKAIGATLAIQRGRHAGCRVTLTGALGPVPDYEDSEGSIA
jgi:PAS domain S-box-containing protein